MKPRTRKPFTAARLAAVLACGLTVTAVRPTPAQATIDPATALAVVKGLYDAYGKIKTLQGHFQHEMTLADAVNTIVGEIRDQRNLWITSRVRALRHEYVEMFQNRQFYGESRWGAFNTESIMVYSYIAEIIARNNDANSAYELAPTLNALIPMRAIAMNNENVIRREMGLPVAYIPKAIQDWLDLGVQANYDMHGASMVRCESPTSHSFPSTVAAKQMWKKFSNYWFVATRGRNFNEPVSCNVFENRCAGWPHTNEQRYKWIGDEDAKINKRFFEDPNLDIVRGGMAALMAAQREIWVYDLERCPWGALLRVVH